MKINKKVVSLIAVGAILLPSLAFAQDPSLTNLQSMALGVKRIVEILIPVVFGLGVLAFFWGLVKYLFGDDHDKDQAKKTMLWGVVAIFVMAAIWGLVRFLGDTFGVDTDATATPASQVVPKL